MKKNKDLTTFVVLIVPVLIAGFALSIALAQFQINKLKDRITVLEEKAFHPVVVERCEEYSDERTYELVQQAFQTEELESYKWFDYAYTVHFGKNDYGQDLIFVTFYYSKVNDPNDYKITVCNYYVSPDVNDWEIVE